MTGFAKTRHNLARTEILYIYVAITGSPPLLGQKVWLPVPLRHAVLLFASLHVK